MRADITDRQLMAVILWEGRITGEEKQVDKKRCTAAEYAVRKNLPPEILSRRDARVYEAVVSRSTPITNKKQFKSEHYFSSSSFGQNELIARKYTASKEAVAIVDNFTRKLSWPFRRRS